MPLHHGNRLELETQTLSQKYVSGLLAKEYWLIKQNFKIPPPPPKEEDQKK